MVRRTQDEMRKIRGDIMLFIQNNNGKANYTELFNYMEREHDFNDSQLSSLLYRMNSNWLELTRPENGLYRLINKDLIVDDTDIIHKDNTVSKQRIVDDLENDLLGLMESYTNRIAKEFLTLTNDEVIEMKKVLKRMDKVFGG